MKKLIIISLVFISCQREKTEIDIVLEKIQEEIDSAHYDHNLPSLPIETGLNTDSLCVD